MARVNPGTPPTQVGSFFAGVLILFNTMFTVQEGIPLTAQYWYETFRAAFIVFVVCTAIAYVFFWLKRLVTR